MAFRPSSSSKRKRRLLQSSAHAEWLALLLDREAASRSRQRPDASRPDCAPLGCGTARPTIEDVDYRVARRRSTRRCSSSWPPAAGSPSSSADQLGRAASASRGSPVRWRRRLAATDIPSTTPACPACSPTSISPTATAVSRGCSASWSNPISSCSMTGGPDRLSARRSGAISWRTVEDRYGCGSTPITSQLPVAPRGTMLSASPLLPTPFSIASSTTLIASSSMAPRCASSKPSEATEPTAARTVRGRWQALQREQKEEPQTAASRLPRGSTGTSRAHRCVSREGTPRHARVPPC